MSDSKGTDAQHNSLIMCHRYCQQDVVQHYGDSVQGRGTMMQSNNGNARARYYWHDLKALIDGRGNHPSIYQWDTFNEQDMMHDFNTSNVVKWCASTLAHEVKFTWLT